MIDELGAFDLADRRIHRDLDRVATGVPRGGLAARFLENPAANVDDLAGLFEQRYELVGNDDASLGVVPPQ